MMIENNRLLIIYLILETRIHEENSRYPNFPIIAARTPETRQAPISCKYT